jgi:8-oxo-dGTP diphosphatase
MTEQEFISNLVEKHRPAAEEYGEWANGSIRIRILSFLGCTLPPRSLISSVRALVFRGSRILVMRNEDSTHIVPGGRVELGETIEAALRREILEEAGLNIMNLNLLGFMHLHHETPKPEGDPHPYPDFFWPVFKAEATGDEPPSVTADDYEVEAVFRPIDEVRRLELTPGEHCYLEAALEETNST